jgi:urease accessory protein
MHVDAQEPPWRVIRAFPQDDGAVLVHLHNVSGGVLAGDDLTLDIKVGPRARVQVTSTGATRLYRHRPGAPDSEQRISFSVSDGALLEYLPDALIPFAGSRHRQRTEVRLEGTGTLFGWELVAPGRQAMGERFLFDSLTLATRVESSQRALLSEDFLVQPGANPPASPARLGDYTHAATFYAFQAGGRGADWRELEQRLGEIAIRESRVGCTIWGTSALAHDGVIVKGLGTTSHRMPAALAGFWAAARHFLTGEQAVPPRKLK